MEEEGFCLELGGKYEVSRRSKTNAKRDEYLCRLRCVHSCILGIIIG